MSAWPTADEMALGDLERVWSAVYTVRYEGGKYRAVYRYDDGTELTADTVAGLDSTIRAHWARTWRPRSDPAPGWAQWAAGGPR